MAITLAKKAVSLEYASLLLSEVAVFNSSSALSSNDFSASSKTGFRVSLSLNNRNTVIRPCMCQAFNTSYLLGLTIHHLLQMRSRRIHLPQNHSCSQF